MTEDSLGKRYLSKLVSNLATVPLYFVMEAVLPRALGPAVYGNFSFATTLFQNFTNFLDMGTSTCLHTSLAKRQQELSLLAFYARFALLMLLICLIAGWAMYLPGAGESLMPGVPLWMAVPSALWAYVTWAGRVARGANDALGITARSEHVRIGVNLASGLALLGLFFGGVLSLEMLYLHQYVFLGLLAAGFIWVLRQHLALSGLLSGGSVWRLSFTRFGDYAGEFARYSSPLFVTALASAVILSGERWLLQYFDGSVAQGYFSLSLKIGVACFLFVTALTPLMMREMAVAHGRRDPEAIARLMDRYAPMIYAVAAWMACFVLVEAHAVIRVFGGREFSDALLPVQIMALYPIHQGYGQLAGSIFYATGETRLLRNVSLCTMLLGLGLTWLLLAPTELYGFAAGPGGLAFKMVVVQIVSVNLLFFFSLKSAPFNLKRNMLHQLLCPLVLTGAALASRYGTEWAGLGAANDVPRFVVSGGIYCILCLALAFFLPFVFGLGKSDLQTLWSRVLGAVSKAKNDA
jgi:Membrane protein involved in the export of O-antigen and teichoic acid